MRIFFLVSLQDAKEQYDRAEEFVKVIEEFLKNGIEIPTLALH